VETVTPKIPSTLDAAILSKMAHRGQIKGAVVDGPLAMDNAITSRQPRPKASPPWWRVMPMSSSRISKAGNMLAKELAFVAQAEAAGLVLGATVPIILTSRADGEKARLASCAIAALYRAWRSGGQLRIHLDEAAE
jgi:phosphate butyryltransferase